MRKGGLGRNYGIDFWSLFCVCEFHCSSLVAICDSFFKCMGYTGIPRIGLFNADVAALSAFSLPVMPTWLGNQQNTTLKDWVERLLFWYNLTSNGMFKENLVNEAIINHGSNRVTHYDKLVSKFSLLSVHSQQTITRKWHTVYKSDTETDLIPHICQHMHVLIIIFQKINIRTCLLLFSKKKS